MVESTAIAPPDKVKNLGVIFDQNMIMDKFVSQKCKTASFALYKIGKIRQFFFIQKQSRTLCKLLFFVI